MLEKTSSNHFQDLNRLKTKFERDFVRIIRIKIFNVNHLPLAFVQTLLRRATAEIVKSAN